MHPPPPLVQLRALHWRRQRGHGLWRQGLLIWLRCRRVGLVLLLILPRRWDIRQMLQSLQGLCHRVRRVSCGLLRLRLRLQRRLWLSLLHLLPCLRRRQLLLWMLLLWLLSWQVLLWRQLLL